MKNSHQIPHWIQAFIYGLGFFFLTVFLGIFIGGNFGFPRFAGLEPGYESAGVLFSFIGFSGGSFITVSSFLKPSKRELFLGVVAALVAFLLSLLSYSRSEGGIFLIPILLLNFILIFGAMNGTRRLGSKK